MVRKSTVPYRYGDQLDKLNDAPYPPWLYLRRLVWKMQHTKLRGVERPCLPQILPLYAKWVPDNINYFLVLRKEGADGKWSQTTETRTGKTDETVTINPADFLTDDEKGTYVIPQTVSSTAQRGRTAERFPSAMPRKRYRLTYDLNTADAAWVSTPVLNPIVWALRSNS